jgi:hypothetical protein
MALFASFANNTVNIRRKYAKHVCMRFYYGKFSLRTIENT